MFAGFTTESEPDSISPTLDQMMQKMVSSGPQVVAGRIPFQADYLAAFGLPSDSAAGPLSSDSLDPMVMNGMSGLLCQGVQVQQRNVDLSLIQQTGQGAESHEEYLAQLPGIAVHERIGKGSYAAVFRCTIEGREGDVAVKVMHRNSELRLTREVELSGKLQHANLVSLLQFIEGRRPTLVLELCAGGSLERLLHRSPGKAGLQGLGLKPRVKSAWEVGSAVEYLHHQGVVHRDVKSANVFLTSQPQADPTELPPVKLGDMGLARPVEACMTRFVGSLRYMAPEVLETNAYGLPADVFSCAILLHELATGNVPFAEVGSDLRITTAIASGRRPKLEELPSPDGAALQAVLQRSWAEEPEERGTASDFVAALGAFA